MLGEASVPYDIVYEIDEINDDLENIGRTLVIGARDTVSSAAEDDPLCSIYCMPIIRMWKSKKYICYEKNHWEYRLYRYGQYYIIQG